MHVGVLIAVLLGVSDEDVASEVFQLRSRVRSHHHDVRANNRVYSTIWDFISDARVRHNKSGLRWISTSEDLEDQLTNKSFVIERRSKRKAIMDSDSPRKKVIKSPK